MKNKTTTFQYGNSASSFISKRIDEDPNYADAPQIFEYFISRNRKAGFEVAIRQPLAPRCWIVSIPNLRDLAFFYVYGGRPPRVWVHVFAVEFAV